MLRRKNYDEYFHGPAQKYKFCRGKHCFRHCHCLGLRSSAPAGGSRPRSRTPPVLDQDTSVVRTAFPGPMSPTPVQRRCFLTAFTPCADYTQRSLHASMGLSTRTTRPSSEVSLFLSRSCLPSSPPAALHLYPKRWKPPSTSRMTRSACRTAWSAGIVNETSCDGPPLVASGLDGIQPITRSGAGTLHLKTASIIDFLCHCILLVMNM